MSSENPRSTPCSDSRYARNSPKSSDHFLPTGSSRCRLRRSSSSSTSSEWRSQSRQPRALTATAGTYPVSGELSSDGAELPALLETGTYRVGISSEKGDEHEYLLAHDSEVEIAEHRGGLDTYVWEGIELSEVSVAALMDEGVPTELPAEWQRLHVFLPTTEPCPYPLLVNGAFASDLSRQEIRVGQEADDYNRFLMRRVAILFRDVLSPQLQADGVSTGNVLKLLDRKADAPGASEADLCRSSALRGDAQ